VLCHVISMILLLQYRVLLHTTYVKNKQAVSIAVHKCQLTAAISSTFDHLIQLKLDMLNSDVHTAMFLDACTVFSGRSVEAVHAVWQTLYPQGDSLNGLQRLLQSCLVKIVDSSVTVQDVVKHIGIRLAEEHNRDTDATRVWHNDQVKMHV
jgi:hypothetical protein